MNNYKKVLDILYIIPESESLQSLEHFCFLPQEQQQKTHKKISYNKGKGIVLFFIGL